MHNIRIKTKIIIVTLAMLAVACKARQKLPYEFPPEIKGDELTMKITEFNKGKALYELNCARCHTTKVKNKDVTPDFTEQQMDNYEMRMINVPHTDNLKELTEDDLILIKTYFLYKRKSNGKK